VNTIVENFFSKFNINQDIVDLLWISDGERTFFDYDVDQFTLDLSGFCIDLSKSKTNSQVQVTRKNSKTYGNWEKKFNSSFKNISLSREKEPSLIDIRLPVEYDPDVDPLDSIDYYPSYKKLTPPQRYIYLNWLSDISKDIDIGYIFLFFYGLERHLVFGDYNNAIKTIRILQKFHKYTFFEHCSIESIIFSAMKKNDVKTLKEISSPLEDYPMNIEELIYAKWNYNLDLSLDDLMYLGKLIGFSSRKYFKYYPSLFKEKVAEVLIERENKKAISTRKIISKPIKPQNPREYPIFYNYSLPHEIRDQPKTFEILIKEEATKLRIKNILIIANSKIKMELKLQEKQGIKIIPEIDDSQVSFSYNYAEKVPICPYCNKTLSVFPKAKKKCQFCNNYIHVRTRVSDRKRILIRADQVDEIEQEWKDFRSN
jgi:hypothetical protein